MASENEKKVVPPSEESGAYDDVETSSVNERKLIRKLDVRLLPAVTILYLLSFLDRANGSSAPGSDQYEILMKQ